MIRAVRAEFARSLRERRWSLFAAAAVILVGDVLLYTVGDAPMTAADVAAGLSATIGGVTVSIDLFGRDLRSRCHALVLRTPGALRDVLVGRLALLFSGIVAALLLDAGLRAAFSGILHPLRDYAMREGYAGALERVPLTFHFTCGLRAWIVWSGMALVASLSLALGSAWTRWRPPAGLFGLAILAFVEGSFSLVAHRGGHFFPVMPSDAVLLVAGLSALAIAALAWGWLRGRRYLAHPAGCAVRGLVLLLTVGAGADVAIAAAVSRFLDLDPGDDDLRIGSAFLGTDRRHVVLQVARGGFDRPDPDSPARESRASAWIVDLETGGFTVLGGDSRLFLPGDVELVPWPARVLAPQPWIVAHSQDAEGEYWIEGPSGSVARFFPGRTRSEPPAEWRREALRANTPVRDSEGRRAWRVESRVEKEGIPPAAPLPTRPSWDHRRDEDLRPGPGGWFGPLLGRPDDPRSYVFLDATSGELRRIHWPDTPLHWSYFAPPMALDPSATLRHVDSSDAGGRSVKRWVYAPIPDGPDRVVGDWIAGGDSVLGVVAEGTVLVARPHPGEKHSAQGLLLWRPETDDKRLLDLSGLSLDRWEWTQVAGRRPDGPWLVELRTESERAYVLLDPAAPSATALTPWLPTQLHAVAIDDDRSLVAIEDERRVVRWGPTPGVRTVLFPR